MERSDALVATPIREVSDLPISVLARGVELQRAVGLPHVRQAVSFGCFRNLDAVVSLSGTVWN